MTLDDLLLSVLACPSDDHAALRPDRRDGADVLVCTHCASVFRIDTVGGQSIPVLLPDEAEPGPNGLGVAAGTGSGG
ncbi:Trm112 family protein [Jatrophihabitans fulvus]